MPTALIVEDEPEANRLLALLVQLRGYRTDSAYTGGEALEMVRSHPPDIVFLDLMLPDINGYEVCRSIKDKRDTSLIPVVMVTARVAVENRLQSFRVGADDYIPKPYTPDQIFQAMADADARRRTLDGPDADGAIRLDTRDDGESLRLLAQLRSLLVARTPLDGDAVGRIGAALREMLASAESWGRQHRVEHVATLAYRLEPDRLSLTVSDGAHWLAETIPCEGWRKWVIPPFDEVHVADDRSRVDLLKLFPSDDPA